MTVATAVATLGGLTLFITTLLVLAHRRLHVVEDPRIDQVESMLPGANCGACGSPGCRAFAEALVLGTAQPAACTVSLAEEKTAIAEFLGVAVGKAVKRVARLACAGGDNVARSRARYVGPQTCLAAAQVGGGGKDCAWGCLGHGDCVTACDFDALRLDRHHLPQVELARCTACGDCVAACPKDLFSLEPITNHLWVRCRNELAGDGILDACGVACTACARCAQDAPAGAVVMTGGLPRIDHGSIALQDESSARKTIDRCPTGAIVWMTDQNIPVLGGSSKHVVRESALRPTAT